MTFKTVLFGYSKKEVKRYIEEQKIKQETLKKNLDDKSEKYTVLERQNIELNAKESLITDSIMDARMTAQKIIKEAEDEAESILQEAERLSEEHLNRAREDINRLNAIKDTITEQEYNMRQELSKIIERHQHALESTDLSTFHTSTDYIEDNVQESDRVLQGSKIQITLPSKQTNEKDVNSNYRDDIPLYTIK